MLRKKIKWNDTKWSVKTKKAEEEDKMGIMSKDTNENPVNVGRHTKSNSSTKQLTLMT